MLNCMARFFRQDDFRSHISKDFRTLLVKTVVEAIHIRCNHKTFWIEVANNGVTPAKLHDRQINHLDVQAGNRARQRLTHAIDLFRTGALA